MDAAARSIVTDDGFGDEKRSSVTTEREGVVFGRRRLPIRAQITVICDD